MNLLEQDWGGSLLNGPSGWRGLERYMKSLVETLKINTESALEFGVDNGYSLKILSQIFRKTIGVDKFQGDSHIIHAQGDAFYESVKSNFNAENVSIVRQDYRDFISNNNSIYDLIHVDIVHFYRETFECAEWSVQHSNVVMIHDTVSFPDMSRVCIDLAQKYRLNYYNIKKYNGLGILYKIN